jgi:hypothetical protein
MIKQSKQKTESLDDTFFKKEKSKINTYAVYKTYISYSKIKINSKQKDRNIYEENNYHKRT